MWVKRAMAFVLLGCIPWLSCRGSSSGKNDGGLEEDAQEEGQREDGDLFYLPDLDPEREFGVVVLPDTQLCSMIGSQDPFDQYRHQCRLELQSGIYRWDRQEESFPFDWVMSMELTPDRLEPVAADPGFCTRQYGESDLYRYECRRSYQLETGSILLAMNLEFDGMASDPYLVLDDSTLLDLWHERAFEVVFVDEFSSRQRLAPCRYQNFDLVTHEIEIEGGDAWHIEQRMNQSNSLFCFSACPSYLIRSVFTRNGNRREVSDHFRMAYTAYVHNYIKNYLVVFDEPLGGVFGLHMHLYGFEPEEPDVEINYLDQNLDTLYHRKVTSYRLEGAALEYW